MDIWTVDFETYYDKEYSLSKMSTEEYICDPRFELMMVGVKKNAQPSRVFTFDTLEEYAQLFKAMNLRGSAVLCHNTQFDGLILAILFGIVPKLLLDTLGMAQALLKPKQRSISLANCLKTLDLGVQKGTYVGNMIGRHKPSLTSAETKKYAEYCRDDCDGEYALFQYLVKQLPRRELEIIDLTLRMYLEPIFELDYDTLTHVYDDTVAAKLALLEKLPPEIKKSQLTSNPQLAELLEKLGVEVPLKVSPTTNKPTYAFAKTDVGWKDLEDEYADDPLIAPILAARVGNKSTITETRAKRLATIAKKFGHLRIPLRYYAAHTGRYGGMEKINCQNLTRINPKLTHRRQLRYALKAPKGYSVLAADLSQIEVRLNAWLSGCNDLLSIFRDGRDPYCEFATKAFRRVITIADEKERFIGKTCILGLGYGMGFKKLQATLRKDDIKLDDMTAHQYVEAYRYLYKEIPNTWHTCTRAIDILCNGGTTMLGPCRAEHRQIILPNGMAIQYNNLRHISTKKYEGWVYDYAGMGRTLWGGKIVENIVQSLARIVVMDQMCQIKKEIGIRPALQAHDELVYVLPTPDIPYYMQEVLRIMKQPPAFAPDLPISATADWGATYGDAK